MEKNNIPPFYVGQKVVAIRNHSTGLFKKGDTFNITGIFMSDCSCKEWEVTVGVVTDKPKVCCAVCGETYEKKSYQSEFKAYCFAPIIENFEAISFEKVLEQELSSVN